MQLRLMSSQDSRCAGQHGRMRIVTAGVHASVEVRLERHLCVFVKGQGVHVATEDDGSARVCAAQVGRDRRGPLASTDFERQVLERRKCHAAGLARDSPLPLADASH